MYLSIDLETGGLDLSCDILQVACVKEGGQFIDIIIKLSHYTVEPFAAYLNRELFDIITADQDKRIVLGYKAAWRRLREWLGPEKYFPLGKNVSGFDLRFLAEKGFPIDAHFKHRCLDVGAMYATEDGVPSLPEILEQVSGTPEFSGKLHDALFDARVCLWLAQRKFDVL